MFGIGGFELFLILLFGFLIFGPDKLPAIAKTVGQAINKFRNAQQEMTKVIQTEVYDPHAEDPLQKPLEALSKLGDSMKSNGSEGKKASEGSTVKASGGTEDKAESFSERKARYDRERAAQKKAAAADAASAKQEQGRHSEAAASGTAKKTVSDISEETSDAKVTDPASRPSADELYGNKPEPKEEEEA